MIGPSLREYVQFILLCESLSIHEPDSKQEAHIYIINDRSPYIQKEDIEKFFNTVTIEKNPYSHRAHFHYDRHASHIILLSTLISTSGFHYDFILKLDTDVLIINPFKEKIYTIVDTHPSYGVAGIVTHDADGNIRKPYPWHQRIYRLTHNLPPCPECDTYYSASKKILQDTLERAVAHGYYLGKSVLGGSYIYSPQAIKTVHRLGIQPDSFFGTHLGEDIVISLIVQAEGFDILDTPSLKDNPFGVWWLRPPHTPWNLARRFSILHSVRFKSRSLIIRLYEVIRKPLLKTRVQTIALITRIILARRYK